MLQQLGFGTGKEFKGDPIAEIRSIRTLIKGNYRFVAAAQTYFEEVENNLDELARAHPLLDNSRKLMMALRAFVDSDADLEYICEDLLTGEPAKGSAIAETKPGLALGAISFLFPSLFKIFETEIHHWLVSGWEWVHKVLSVWTSIFALP